MNENDQGARQHGAGNGSERVGSDLGRTLRELLRQGNRRRVLLTRQGEVLLRLPLTLVAVLALLLLWRGPAVLVLAVGLVLVFRVRVTLERTPEPPPSPNGA